MLAPLLCGAAALFGPIAPFPQSDQPARTTGGWRTATPESRGLQSGPLTELDAFARAHPEHNMHGVLVVADDHLVFERYYTGTDQSWGRRLGRVEFDRNTLHDLRSMTKSVTSALVGIAIGKKQVPGVQTKLPQLFPSRDALLKGRKRDVTLEHVLSMSAGLKWQEMIPYTLSNTRNDAMAMHRGGDPVRYVLSREMAAEPGTTFQYNGGLSTLLSAIVGEGCGKPIDEYAREVLFEPLGIRSFQWHRNAGGLPSTSSGLRLRPRDLAKFGSLYLNRGKWRGKQVVPAEWVEQSLRSYAQPPWTLGYGYQWWLHRLRAGERSIDVASAIGLGGQRIFVIPSLDLVVVMTAGHYNSPDHEHKGFCGRLLARFVLPAAGVRDATFVRPTKK